MKTKQTLTIGKPIKLIYTGVEQCDFLYYIICVLAPYANKIIVADNSVSNDLFHSMCAESEADVHEIKNVLFAKNADLNNSEEVNLVDVVIDYEGENPVIDFTTEDLTNAVFLVKIGRASCRERVFRAV